jgi:hypothetical protein
MQNCIFLFLKVNPFLKDRSALFLSGMSALFLLCRPVLFLSYAGHHFSFQEGQHFSFMKVIIFFSPTGQQYSINAVRPFPNMQFSNFPFM